MKILEASENCIDAILTLCKNCSEHMIDQGIDQWDEVYPNKAVFLEDIRTKSLFLAGSPNISEHIMGCIVLNEHQDPEYEMVNWQYTSEKIAVIHRLMVDPLYQRQGIAQHLMSYAENVASERKYGAIRLDTFIENEPAIRFYKKRGYEAVGNVFFRKGKFLCFEKRLSS
ncbi:GNAT family N-acetyltransferase [Desulfitobacterium metallireducens]|uniref:Acetyltransferase n=1 Tax=Desulfitobacterium metallireducens DSM 15288 TaxID=871968 RepID=W0EBI1_9FIRM|nr:GNAT family N-acetyltransferase [Desulfitobacterium metallireducens]AHF06426.1 acetyltransferase [Desulfitobacterium metallireducens DSM 15288]